MVKENEFEFGFGYDDFDKWFECLLTQCMSEFEETVLVNSKQHLFENWISIID